MKKETLAKVLFPFGFCEIFKTTFFTEHSWVPASDKLFIRLAAHLPPVDGHQIHSLLLHVNRLTLNPFPDELDELLYTPTKNSDLITLRSSQKYFIPSRSVVTL